MPRTTAMVMHQSRRDHATIALAAVAVIACASATHALRGATTLRLETLVVRPALWLLPVALLAIIGRHHVVEAVRSRGWAYHAFVVGGLQVGVSVAAGFIFGFGASPWSSSPLFTITGFVWQAVAVLAGQEVMRTVLARGLARREGLALIVPWLALWAVTVPWTGVQRLFDGDTALPYLGSVVLPAGGASLLATYLALRGGAIASLTYLLPLTVFEMVSPALPNLPWGVTAMLGVGIPALALCYLPDSLEKAEASEYEHARRASTQDDAAAAPTSARRLSWFHAALLSVVLGYFSFGLLGFTPTVINGISMEPGMHTGDVVITRDVDPHEIEVGDVIRFRRGNGSVVHRVIEVRIGADGEPEFVTQGDNNPAPDSPVRADDVVGVFAFRIPKVGWPIYWIRSVLS